MTMKSFELQGILDNCQDFIDYVVPANTYFVNNVKRVPTKTPSYSWITTNNDAFNTLSTGKLEVITGGEAGTDTDILQTKRYGNVQRFSKFVTVSKSAATAAIHGGISQTQLQLEKAVAALKNEMEMAFMSAHTHRTGTATLPALTSGIIDQIQAGNVITGGITKTTVDDACDRLFMAGSEADLIVCGKGAFDVLSPLSNGYVDGVEVHGKKVPSYVDNQGRVYGVIASRYLPDNTIVLTTEKDWSMVVFRDWTISKLDTKGSYDQYLVEIEVGIRNDASGMAAVVKP